MTPSATLSRLRELRPWRLCGAGRGVRAMQGSGVSETLLELRVYRGIAWGIIAPKLEAGENVSRARVLSAYEGSRTVRAVAA